MFLNRFPRRLYTSDTPIIELNESRSEALAQLRQKILEGHIQFEPSPCLCGSDNDRLLATKDRFALDVRTVICKSCGLMRTDPQMTEKSLGHFYENDYRLLYGGTSKASADFFAEQLLRGKGAFDLANQYLKPSPSEQAVLDIGCGAGGMLTPFQKAGYKTYGCDLGSQYLEYGRNLGLTLEHGSSDSLLKYGKADLIMLNHVLEHFKDPQKEILKLSSMLTDDGLLYIELPGVLSIKKTYGDFLLFLQNAHLFHFTLNTLCALMGKAGFELVEGNENIQAVFRKATDNPLQTGTLEYLRIIRYLTFV